jgi:hypothetical protein
MTQRNRPAKDLACGGKSCVLDPEVEVPDSAVECIGTGSTLLHSASFQARASLVELALHVNDPELPIFHLAVGGHRP